MILLNLAPDILILSQLECGPVPIIERDLRQVSVKAVDCSSVMSQHILMITSGLFLAPVNYDDDDLALKLCVFLPKPHPVSGQVAGPHPITNAT